MTAKTKSERLKRLVSHGYFAPELPPCFVSDDMAKYRSAILSAIDALPLTPRGTPGSHAYISEPAWFYFPRFGKEDRRHGVPNPLAHLMLSRALADNYVDLRRKARSSKITLSPPVFDWSGPRALIRPSVDLRDDFRIQLSSRREEYVTADIRAFFHSIYTHSIAWAIHGKQFAKKNRHHRHYGNLIDLLCRNSQDGQTVGLPVGPDTSRLVAEVIAAAVDTHLLSTFQMSSRDASRYIDDYTISSSETASGEALLAALRQSAAYFELELNADKSAIYPTSHRQNTGWQQVVKAHLPQPASLGGSVKIGALQHFLYRLGRLCADHPDVNIEKFGLQSARSALVNADDWKTLQFHLINAYRRNSTLVSLLVEACLLRNIIHRDVDVDTLVEFVENRIPVLARENRTGEIIWLLFLAARLNLTLAAKSLAPLLFFENSFIALLVVFIDSRGKVRGTIDRSIWDQSLNAAGLQSPMWLYAYEAVTRGFLPNVSDDFIVQHKFFAPLRAVHAQFLDMSRGYTSIAATLRSLRNDNARLRRLRDAIEDDDFESFDDIYDSDGDKNLY